MATLETWVQEDLQPHITLLFDVPVEVSMERLAKARQPDKFERESYAFFHKIRQAYLLRAAENPNRFRIIDANQPLEVVNKLVEDIITSI